MKTITSLLLPGLLATLAVANAQEPPAVAGLRPYERPAGSPMVREFVPGSGWQAQALRGLGEPATGVGFLKDQGAWYTPFTRPNLLGRYDLRGLHAAPRKDQP